MAAMPEVAAETVSAALAAGAASRPAAAARSAGAVDWGRTASTFGAAVVLTTGRSKETVAVGAAVTASAVCAEPDSVDAETPAVVSAAFAGRPMLRIRPDAAATTAAWRPTVPAFALTALDTASRGLVRTVCARWRAE